MSDARPAVSPNDGLRLLLELAALAALGYWGWTVGEGAVGVVLALAVPLLAALLWAVFRFPGDPGPAPVPVSGPVRLLLETVLFGAAVVLLADAGRQWLATVLAALLVVHYAVDRERVATLTGR